MYCARYHKCPRKQQTLAEVEKNQEVFSICVFNMNFIWIWILIILIIFDHMIKSNHTDLILDQWFILIWIFQYEDAYWKILFGSFSPEIGHTSDLKCCLSIFLSDSLGPSCRSSHNAWMVFKSGLIGLQICPWDLLVPGHVWEANQLIKVKQIEMWGDN